MRVGQFVIWTDPRGTFGTQKVRLTELRSVTEATIQFENGLQMCVLVDDLRPSVPA
jgi:hypothetical protein